MIVVGIDPSYARTGVATTGECRSYELPPGPMPWRRSWLRGQLAATIRTADIVAIEGLYPATQRGWLDRAYLLGTLIDQAWQYDCGILLVAPASPKILACGNGGPATDKTAMLAAARAAGSPAANGDEADAWWIAQLAHLLSLAPITPLSPYRWIGGGDPLPAHRLRALDPYRPPWTPRHPDPWIRHPEDRP